jgi:hypothetical protein
MPLSSDHHVTNANTSMVAHLHGSFIIMHPKLHCTLLSLRGCLQACCVCVSIHYSNRPNWLYIHGAELARESPGRGCAARQTHNLIHLPPTRHHYSSSMYHTREYVIDRGTSIIVCCARCVCHVLPPAMQLQLSTLIITMSIDVMRASRVEGGILILISEAARF